MRKYQLTDGNTILADQKFIDDNFPGATLLPEEIISEPFKPLLSQLAFKRRFPRAKWKAALVAAKTDADLEDFFEDMKLAKHLDLTDPGLVSAIAFLSSEATPVNRRLTQAESDAILKVSCRFGEEP